MSSFTIQQVCESNLRWLMNATLESDPSENKVTWYAFARLFYLKSDLRNLKALIKEKTATTEHSDVTMALTRVRLGIREKDAVIPLDEPLNFLESYEGPFKPEAALVVAQYYDNADNHSEAERRWMNAFAICKKFRYEKKAATAFHNSIAARSRVHSEETYIDEYWHAYTLAVDANDWQTAGMALCNLARDFQIRGCLNTAMKHIDRSVSILENYEYRSMGYFLALANRCHIAIDLDDQEKALSDFEEISTSKFKEAESAVSTLHSFLAEKGILPDRTNDSKGAIYALATWFDRRAEDKKQRVKLTKLEQQLIEALAQGPKSKYDLIDEIYQDAGDLLAKENRLKQLIFRLRGKNFNLLADGDYGYRLRI